MKIFFIVKLLLGIFLSTTHASDFSPRSVEESVCILTGLTTLKEAHKTKSKDQIGIIHLNLNVVYINEENSSTIHLYNYTQSRYFGFIKLNGRVSNVGHVGKKIFIDVNTTLRDRLEFVMLRHTEVLGTAEKRLIDQISSRLQWKILNGEEKSPVLLLSSMEFYQVEQMPDHIKEVILPYLGTQKSLIRMRSCWF